jgi:hypothetical protein
MEMPGTQQFLLSVVIGIIASIGIFAHAERHGGTHATAWGVAAFLAAPFVVPFYFVRFWLMSRRSR